MPALLRRRSKEVRLETIAPFALLGLSHLTALALIFVAGILIGRTPRRNQFRGDYGASNERALSATDRLATTIALVLLFLVVFKPILFIGFYNEPWERSLPLDLCRINEFVCIFMLARRSYRAFEISYFLSIGSIIALLMPNLPLAFPDPRFVLFFLSHGLSVLAIVYALFVYGFRPTLRSVGTAIVFLSCYTLVVSGFNLLLDANYLFLREKPAGSSILDLFGPWPVYVVVQIGLAIGLCYLSYLPFAFKPKKAGGIR